MQKQISIILIFSLLLIIGLLKPVGFDPDSRHYYDWISGGIYQDVGAELIFVWVSELFVFVAGQENAYYYVNAFYIIGILLITSLTANVINSPAYLWIFFSFCYVSLVLTQIRFGLCLVSMVHAFVHFNQGRKFHAVSFLIFSLLNHYFGVAILILFFMSFVIHYFGLNLFNLLWVIVFIIASSSVINLLSVGVDFIGTFANDVISNKLNDNLNNNVDNAQIIKSSTLFVFMSLLYLYVRFRSNKLIKNLNIVFLLGAAVFATGFNHVLHIRLFQLYVLILYIAAFSYFQINIIGDYITFFIFVIFPLLFFINDIFRNNFFGV